MKGDFSRFTFDPRKHYNGVLMQQGRVQLDADWNEYVEIQNHLRGTMAGDLIGQCGVPRDCGGFEVGVTDNHKDLTILPGRIYVDGLLCELEEGRSFEVEFLDKNRAKVPDLITHVHDLEVGQWLELLAEGHTARPQQILIEKIDLAYQSLIFRPEVVDEIFESASPKVRRITTYASQVDLFPESQEKRTSGKYLAYLDIWQRHITVTDDPKIREVALGGADTTTRTKTVWQLKLRGPLDSEENFDRDWSNLVERREASLAARILRTDPQDDLMNRLYRIEVHDGGRTGCATFKWSRDNGRIIWPVERVEGRTVTIRETVAADKREFRPGQMVEITDEIRELRGQPGLLASIESTDWPTLSLKEDIGKMVHLTGKKLKLNRWDNPEADVATTSSGWINLEKGVQVRFAENGEYQSGDYWLIPMRAASGRIEWPEDLLIQRFGVEHHYCRLAELDWKEDIEEWSVTKDLRILFPPVSDLGDRGPEREPDPRLREAINSILRGKMPSDPESKLMLGKRYFESFKDRRGDIWLFGSHGADIWCKRHDSGCWGEDELVIEGRGECSPVIYEDSSANIWVFWCQKDDIWYKKYTSGVWEADKPLTMDGIPKSHLVVFKDRRGDVWGLFWWQEGSILSTRHGSDGWNEVAPVTAADEPVFEVFGDSEGGVWLFWRQENNIWAGRYGLGGLEGIAALTTGLAEKKSSDKMILEGPDGNIWLFWEQEENIWFSRYVSGAWEGDTMVTKGTSPKTSRKIFKDSRGDLWVFWWQEDNIWSRKCSSNGSQTGSTVMGAEWDKALRLTAEDNTDKEYLKVLEDSRGVIWAFWWEDGHILYKKYISDSWGAVKDLTEAPYGSFVRAFENSRKDIWVLIQRPDCDNIWCKRYADGDWLAEIRLTTGRSKKNFLATHEDRGGNALVFWTADDSNYLLCKKCYDFL